MPFRRRASGKKLQEYMNPDLEAILQDVQVYIDRFLNSKGLSWELDFAGVEPEQFVIAYEDDMYHRSDFQINGAIRLTGGNPALSLRMKGKMDNSPFGDAVRIDMGESIEAGLDQLLTTFMTQLNFR